MGIKREGNIVEDLKERAVESIIHTVIITIFSLAIIYFIATNIPNNYFLMSVSMLGIIFILNYIKKPYIEEDKNKLAINSWICLTSIIFIGVLIGKMLSFSALIGFGLGLSVFDVISFTKIGSKTTNAKVMKNKNLTIKLIVYGTSFKSNKPVPTLGFGDFLFYTILVSSIYKFSSSIKILFYSMCLILLGVIINLLITWFIYEKDWYKGFPATFIPFILIVLFMILNFSYLTF